MTADLLDVGPQSRQVRRGGDVEPIALTIEQLTARHPRVRCTAHRSRTGEPCRAWAMRGCTVCAAHGGRAPQVRDAADRRVMIARAIRAAPQMPMDGPPSARHLVAADDTPERAEWAAGVLAAVRARRVWA